MVSARRYTVYVSMTERLEVEVEFPMGLTSKGLNVPKACDFPLAHYFFLSLSCSLACSLSLSCFSFFLSWLYLRQSSITPVLTELHWTGEAVLWLVRPESCDRVEIPQTRWTGWEGILLWRKMNMHWLVNSRLCHNECTHLPAQHPHTYPSPLACPLKNPRS